MASDQNQDSSQQISLPQIKRRKRGNNKEKGFLEQEISLVDSILFPDGYENIMLGIYFLIVPYIAGVLFIFFVIGKGDYTVFLALNDENSFFLTWAIGYEVAAALILLWILKLALFDFIGGSKKNDGHAKRMRIP
jgi:hypothetical protein